MSLGKTLSEMMAQQCKIMHKNPVIIDVHTIFFRTNATTVAIRTLFDQAISRWRKTDVYAQSDDFWPLRKKSLMEIEVHIEVLYLDG